ncbi:hypothetical protein Q8A67_008924 [Cirrhinus molitorella]|uniref:Uncharacterized protein n=1 Tax=Cirrhinus molitorella TaxID=172907 RepID=A0AA88Q0V3_9TELE|nr:hypothetical protein Q8A67_008924 [Cirrhinus molitorella]
MKTAQLPFCSRRLEDATLSTAFMEDWITGNGSEVLGFYLHKHTKEAKWRLAWSTHGWKPSWKRDVLAK